MIPYGHQSISDDDIEAVVKVLRGDWLTQGPVVEEFEERLAAITEARYAVVFSNGTAALHAACTAAGVGPGSTLATSTLTFVASANCGLYTGADVALVDIDPATLNLDPLQIPADIDALVAVHYAGLPIDMSALPVRPRVIIEDAAHAIGARTPSGPVGNCAHSDMTIFSFHPVKTITAAEGGAVTTNSPELAEALRRFRTHGIIRPDPTSHVYVIEEIGYNYRLSDLHAALGNSQLVKLDSFIARRNELAAQYRELLEPLPVKLAPEAPGDAADGWLHGRHLYPVRVAQRDKIFKTLRSRGIGVQVHYVPVYRHHLYREMGHAPHAFPATESAYHELLSLPLYPDLTDAQQRTVVDELESAIHEVAPSASASEAA